MSTQTVEIKGREYTVEEYPIDQATHPRLHWSMTERGWVPSDYLLTGRRGATYAAYRSARTGDLTIIHKV